MPNSDSNTRLQQVAKNFWRARIHSNILNSDDSELFHIILAMYGNSNCVNPITMTLDSLKNEYIALPKELIEASLSKLQEVNLIDFVMVEDKYEVSVH